MKKPKVLNSGRGFLDKKIKILEVLEDYPEGLTPKHIALYSGLNHNTIKGYLRKIPEVEVKKDCPGFYTLVTKDTYGVKRNKDIREWKIQNIHFSIESDNINIPKRVLETNLILDVIKYRFEVGKDSKKATLRVSTDYPLDISCLIVLAMQFITLIEKHCSFKPTLNEIFISSLESNFDHYSLSMDGCTFIRLDSFIAEYKIYFKNKSFVRQEYKTKIPMNIKMFSDMIHAGLYYSEDIFNQEKIKDDLANLKKDNRKLFQILSNFIERKNG